MILLFVSIVFSTAIFFIACVVARDPPPLYNVRMEKKKKRFENDKQIKKYTAQLKKERQQEEAEAAKIQIMRPVTNAVENKGKATLAAKKEAANKPESVMKMETSAVSGKQKEKEENSNSSGNRTPVNVTFTPKASTPLEEAKPPSSTMTGLPLPTGNKTIARSVEKTNVLTAVRPVSHRKMLTARPDSMKKVPPPSDGKRTPEPPNLKSAVVADKSALNFVVAGGQQRVKLTNKSRIPLIIKTRCSDNQILGVVPVFSHVEAGKSVEVTVTRLGALAKKDKVVFEWLPECKGEKDLAGHFKKYEIVENKIELQIITK